MNNNNASLNTQPKELTYQALEVVMKLFNGYQLAMANETVSDYSPEFLKKGQTFSTYRRVDLMRTNGNNTWALAKSSAPMSEIEKIKLAMAKDMVRKQSQTPEIVKLGMGVTGMGAYTKLYDLYESGSYVKMLEEVCSFATPEQLEYVQQQLQPVQLPAIVNTIKEFANRHHSSAASPRKDDFDSYRHV